MRLQQSLLVAALAALLLFGPVFALAESPELVFGMSAPFSGASRGLGIEYYRGLSAFLNAVNAEGGVNGRLLRVKAYDDGYNPIPTMRNTIQLVQQDKVFALFSYVGTPTATRILPLLKRFQREHVYLLFPLTGAQPLREPPYGEFVYNLRASYFEETRGLVEHFLSLGRKRIAVFYQADAYGRNGWDGVCRALDEHGLSLSGDAAYQRGARFPTDFGPEVEILKTSEPDAVITVGSYAATAAFIRDARDHGLHVPVATVSFSDSDNMLKLLQAVEDRQNQKGRYTRDLICAQVVPSYEDQRLPVVQKYRALMDEHAAMPPHELLREPYVPHQYSFVSFEGFLNGMLLVEMIRRMDDNPDPARIPEAMAALDGWDFGLGQPLRFGTDCRQGLDRVYYVTVLGDRFVPVDDWSRWKK